MPVSLPRAFVSRDLSRAEVIPAGITRRATQSRSCAPVGRPTATRHVARTRTEPDAWLEPMGVASLVCEALFVILFVLAQKGRTDASR